MPIPNENPDAHPAFSACQARFEAEPTSTNLLALAAAAPEQDLRPMLLRLRDFDVGLLQAEAIARIDNSSIEGLVLQAWQLPPTLGGHQVLLIEDTYPHSVPSANAWQIRLLEPEDRILIARRGRGGKNFFALETLVSCLRGETRVWQADFELNSHWGGISDDEVIAGMQAIAQKAGIGLEVRDVLIEPEPQNPAGA